MNSITKTLAVGRAGVLSMGTALAMLLVLLVGMQTAHAMITNQLDYGESGEDVTEVQTFYARDASIYPSGLVTGYFGPLTQAATQRFQAAQGIVSSGSPQTTGFGRVGPQTMARINTLLGGGMQTYWDTVPVLSAPNVSVTNTTATFMWATNELTQGQVYWDTVPLRTDEATGYGQNPYISGTLALDSGGLQMNHTVTISNLQANTIYYYTVRSVDAGNNMSMIWPSYFRTNP